MRSGDEAAAIEAFRSLVGSSDPHVDAEARLGFGEALLADGKAREAIDAFSALRKAYPETGQADLAQFFSARAWDMLGEHLQAIDGYRAYAERDPEIRPYLGLLIADRLARSAGLTRQRLRQRP
jgi:tetratricopeptide (TPR) repeat protein